MRHMLVGTCLKHGSGPPALQKFDSEAWKSVSALVWSFHVISCLWQMQARRLAPSLLKTKWVCKDTFSQPAHCASAASSRCIQRSACLGHPHLRLVSRKPAAAPSQHHTCSPFSTPHLLALFNTIPAHPHQSSHLPTLFTIIPANPFQHHQASLSFVSLAITPPHLQTSQLSH